MGRALLGGSLDAEEVSARARSPITYPLDLLEKFGAGIKGDPAALLEERLAGRHFGGVPKGLLPCLCCGEWRGEYFDPLYRNLVVRVHCRRENDNRCAGCGELLHDPKLNANHFDPADGIIWHTPAFCLGALECHTFAFPPIRI